jgi:hypothetical protein
VALNKDKSSAEHLVGWLNALTESKNVTDAETVEAEAWRLLQEYHLGSEWVSPRV